VARDEPGEGLDILEKVESDLASLYRSLAALKFAREVETSAGEHHLKNALGSSNPEIAGLLRSLGNGDEEHLAKLTALLRKRSPA